MFFSHSGLCNANGTITENGQIVFSFAQRMTFIAATKDTQNFSQFQGKVVDAVALKIN